MAGTIIVEGEEDRAVLDAVLRPERAQLDLRLVAAGGRSAAVSTGRTLLASQNEPTLVVVDGDGADRARLRDELYASLSAASIGAACGVLVIDPDLDTWVFSETGVLDRVLGQAAGHRPLPSGVSLKPRLREMASTNGVRWPELLLAINYDAGVVKDLRESDLGRELLAAVGAVFAPVAAGA